MTTNASGRVNPSDFDYANYRDFCDARMSEQRVLNFRGATHIPETFIMSSARPQ